MKRWKCEGMSDQGENDGSSTQLSWRACRGTCFWRKKPGCGEVPQQVAWGENGGGSWISWCSISKGKREGARLEDN